jgi:hypothetical protein
VETEPGNQPPEKSIQFAYSPVWRLLAFLLPVAIYYFAIRGLLRTHMEQVYLIVALVCGAVALGPHLFIAAVLSGSFRVGPEGVSRVWFGRRHTLPWSKILEVRDFLNQIQIIPARESHTIYVQFYHNLVQPVTFHRTLIEHARTHEVNLMLRPTTRRFLPIRWRGLLLLALIIGTGAVLITVNAFRTEAYQAVMQVGFMAGCTCTTVSAALWMTVSKSHKRIRAQGMLFQALYWMMLLLPVLILGAREIGRPAVNLLLYAVAYLFGYFTGSGLLGLFYPNRDTEPKDHAEEVLGGRR